MSAINQYAEGNNAYVLTLGVEQSRSFKVYADNEAEAAEFLAEHLIAHNENDAYFNALEVNLMASSKNQSMHEFADECDLYHCPNHHIYLPDLGVQEVSV